ncbi:MAG TPA: ABC transporter permease [Sedimentisphaerales bacterium]|nr:ABC transporter permease [Sedimentisphaerales bacterium]
MRQTRIARNIWLGIENLLLHKLRSFLTMLGVVFGVGSVVAMLAVGEGASEEAMTRIRKLGSDNIILTSVKSAQEEAMSTQRSNMSIYGLTYADYRRISESFPNVLRVAPAKLLRKESRLRERSMELRVVGATPDWFPLVPRPLVAGRVIRQEDQDKRAPVAVLTEYGARRLLATQGSIGQSLRIGGKEFEVVGIIQSEGGQSGSVQVPDQEIDVYIPLEVAQRYYGDIFTRRTAGSQEREKVELHQIIVQVDDPKNAESVAAAIERMLERFHKKKDYAVSVPLALLKQAEATKRTFNIVLGSIAGISLLVGGIGIMNIMLAAVTERTREIGIRRAIGAKRRQIVFQFLIETVVLSMFGGLIGLGIGAMIPFLITHFSGMATVMKPYCVVLPLAISMSIGIVFGLYPALHAAKVDPIVALRHE